MSNNENIINDIKNSNTSLGFELGSTRIKAVLIDCNYTPIATGNFTWENKLQGGFWTYDIDDVWKGLQASFVELKKNVEESYGIKLNKVGSIGISAMMHGYLAFDKKDNLLVPFRTWRNTTTEESAKILTEKFDFNIPQRWNIAHLYQAMLNNEEHVSDIYFLTTLAGYVHYKLTGQKVLGIGDTSGVFPIDSNVHDYNPVMVKIFDSLIKNMGFSWNLKSILPKVLEAGQAAGVLTPEGAKLLDPTGNFEAGIPLCPPEGDAGTGMVATNSIKEHTGNVSAGTSIFAMLVLEKELSKVYPEIDMVTTPHGMPVAMVHCNNCSSDLDAWVNLFGEASCVLGGTTDKNTLYNTLYKMALQGDSDCGGLLSYNYFSGEPITDFEEGRPLLVRTPDSSFTLPNLMRNLIFSAMATLKIGMDILTLEEKVTLEKLLGHGGFFKTEGVGQSLMAATLDIPVSVMTSAGEGGAWGIAILAAYLKDKSANESLEDFLSGKVFLNNLGSTLEPKPDDVESFNLFLEKYIKGLAIQRSAVENLDA